MQPIYIYIYHIVVAAYIYSSTCGGFFYEISAVFPYPVYCQLIYIWRGGWTGEVLLLRATCWRPHQSFLRWNTVTYIIAQTWVFKRNSTLISAALRLLHLPIFVAHYNCFILYLYWLWAMSSFFTCLKIEYGHEHDFMWVEKYNLNDINES